MLKDNLLKLNKKFLEESYFVSKMMHDCIDAILTQDLDRLKEIIEVDELKVNESEIKIEKDCVKLIALYQPTAKDLREIVMILKINNDLERIADIIVNIADSGIKIGSKPNIYDNINIREMADTAVSMLDDAIRAHIDHNITLAKEVCQRDDVVDKIRDANLQNIITHISSNPNLVETDLHLLRISKSIERIADHVTNIAEDVVYMEDASIIKHNYLDAE
jgi:phosphate transport system protein